MIPNLLLIHDVSLRLGETERDLPRSLARRLKIAKQRISAVEIRKRSLDCRKGREPRWIHSVTAEIDLQVADKLVRQGKARVWDQQRLEIEQYSGDESPVVVGTGPAGLFCALRLVQAGAKPRII
ncbi:MAG: hypothetical protein GWP35_08440 [Proteobacteria bacterium]|nr:hypothetical protein [Pseudomonadota bacterium]